MEDTALIYLDTLEYERIRNTTNQPETWCSHVEGYWVQIVKPTIYELEYRGLMTDDEAMSVYIQWN